METVRMLKLQDQEVRRIETALQSIYDLHMKALKDYPQVFIGDKYKMMLHQADMFHSLKIQINNGERDV